MGQNTSSFGTDFDEVWPLPDKNLHLTDFGETLLRKCLTIEKPDTRDINVEDFMFKSSNFPLEFGTNTCRVIGQPRDRHSSIDMQISSAYPVLHEHCIGLYLAFLEHKCFYGNETERKLYNNLTITDLVQRILEKRCATFLGPYDMHKLVSGELGRGGFEKVGSENEKSPLVLANVLSYDEIKLSALLSVSSLSEFINNGGRHNRGIIEEDKNTIEREGVIIGLIGARICKSGFMEYEDIIINETQNITENGYGEPMNSQSDTSKKDYRRIWKQFYEEEDYLFGSVQKNHKRFGDAWFKNDIFDNLIMKKRYAISFDTLLLESESRAVTAGKQAYVHVVGIGLGAWKIAKQQDKIFLETFEERLQVLLPKLSHVGVVHFSWFELNRWRGLKDGARLKSETHPDGGINIIMSRRNPASKLPSEYENMLLVVSYAWDGNALPGNDFWVNQLSSSGDPAAACSTLISELHNPHINSKMVNGSNLHIASPRYGILHISDYAKKYFH